MHTHLKLHVTQLKQMTQGQTHTLHDLNAYSNPRRNIKDTIFSDNEHTNIIISESDITTEKCRKKLKHIHTTITSQYLSSRKNNKITNTTPYGTHLSKQTLPRHMRTKPAQRTANKSPLLQSYLYTVNLKHIHHNAHYACHTHMILIISLTVVKHQHNTIRKKPLEAPEAIQEWES